MEIILFNTMSRRKEVFQPIIEGRVKIYTCGPTVYDYPHIGNLRAYVFADVLKRTLLLNGYEVRHVINLTDVGHLTSDSDSGQDKIEMGAKREGKTVWEIADFYIEAFYHDLDLLGIIKPDVFCRATDHIAEIIAMIKRLEENGYTYIAGGNVYYDTSKFKDYGKLARLSLSPDATRARVETDQYKQSPFDFVLWFTRYKYASHEMQWDSPWGRGFPGWHIECSAMATNYLGEQFDIHTGGIDHIPVHHTNEIAQSEGALGHKWVNYWLHNDFLTLEKGFKMAKSEGNFLRLQTLIDAGYTPDVYRFYLLGGQYRSPMVFSIGALDGARNTLNRLRTRLSVLKKSTSEPGSKMPEEEKYEQEFNEALNDDLNTPRGLAVLWKVVDATDLSSSSKLRLIGFFDTVFGLGFLSDQKTEEIPDAVRSLAGKRMDLRKAGKWQESDELRQQILALGYDVMDLKEGYELKKRQDSH